MLNVLNLRAKEKIFIHCNKTNGELLRKHNIKKKFFTLMFKAKRIKRSYYRRHNKEKAKIIDIITVCTIISDNITTKASNKIHFKGCV